MSQSIFFEEWRRCLEAHYKDVVRRRDLLTEKTLQGVMMRVGFREDDLRSLYLQATLHVDDIGADFVPNFDYVEQATELMPAIVQEDERTFQPHPAECTCVACMDKVDTLRHDDEGQPLDVDAIQENIERQQYEEPAAERNTPVQRSLF
jgi:hypothetical protein